jgi:hypothetical protein
MSAADRPVTRRSKIAQLPRTIREQLNQRILDGQLGPTILRWLNDAAKLKGAHAVNPQNLSAWRVTGYADWKKEQARVEEVRKLSDYAFNLARAAGGDLSEGSAAIAGGQILTLLEAAQASKADAETLKPLVDALVSLRSTELATKKVAIDQAKLAQKDRELELSEKRFRRQTAEMFVEWAGKNEVLGILNANTSHTDKIERLGKQLFGEDWE